MPRNTTPTDNLDYIKERITRDKPIAARRVSVLLDKLAAAEAEIERLRAELARAATGTQRSRYD